MQPQTAALENPFADAEEGFAQLRDKLGARETMGMTHAQVEALIDAEGREVLRQLFQSHLTVRTRDERVHAQVVGADGARRGMHRRGSRALGTLFGRVEVERVSYGARRHGSLMPMDAELSLPPTLYSDGVERRVAEQVAQRSFDESVHLLRTSTGAKIAKRQVEAVAIRAAADFDAYYETRQPTSPPSTDDSIMVLSFDGKGVVMRKEALRPQTAQAAEQRTHKLAKRLSKGEKRNCRRMAMVAAIYSIAPFVRTPEQVVREMRPVHEVQSKRPRPQNKRLAASLAKPPPQVVTEFFEEARRRDPEHKKRWVVLVDGAEEQLSLVVGAAGALGIEVTVVMDVIHVIEYLWDAALCFHAEGTKAAEAWVSERLLEVLRGKASLVAAGMRRSATLRRLAAAKRRAVDRCANYLLNHRTFLAYDAYLAAGYPIATGVIEGACRYLVKDRMDITGARWGLDGAEAVLRLRALRASGDLDAYWAFRQQREHERNHLSRYANRKPPPASAPRPLRPSRGPALRVVK